MKPTAMRQPREPSAVMAVRFDWLVVDSPRVAKQLRARVQRHRCPCHLFVDEAGWVYILPDTHPAAERWPIERFDWFVGTYAYVHRGKEPMLRPDDAGIAEDLTEHISELRGKSLEASAG